MQHSEQAGAPRFIEFAPRLTHPMAMRPDALRTTCCCGASGTAAASGAGLRWRGKLRRERMLRGVLMLVAACGMVWQGGQRLL